MTTGSLGPQGRAPPGPRALGSRPDTRPDWLARASIRRESATGMDTTYLNFSWVIDGTLPGCARPLFAKDLTFIASQGIRAIVRLATKEELALERDEVTA